MAINRLGEPTGKKKHTTKLREADFHLNLFTFIAYRNNRFSFPYKPLLIRRLGNSADAHISSLGYLWSSSSNLKLQQLNKASPWKLDFLVDMAHTLRAAGQ